MLDSANGGGLSALRRFDCSSEMKALFAILWQRSLAFFRIDDGGRKADKAGCRRVVLFWWALCWSVVSSHAAGQLYLTNDGSCRMFAEVFNDSIANGINNTGGAPAGSSYLVPGQQWMSYNYSWRTAGWETWVKVRSAVVGQPLGAETWTLIANGSADPLYLSLSAAGCSPVPDVVVTNQTKCLYVTNTFARELLVDVGYSVTGGFQDGSIRVPLRIGEVYRACVSTTNAAGVLFLGVDWYEWGTSNRWEDPYMYEVMTNVLATNTVPSGWSSDVRNTGYETNSWRTNGLVDLERLKLQVISTNLTGDALTRELDSRAQQRAEAAAKIAGEQASASAKEGAEARSVQEVVGVARSVGSGGSVTGAVNQPGWLDGNTPQLIESLGKDERGRGTNVSEGASGEQGGWGYTNRLKAGAVSSGGGGGSSPPSGLFDMWLPDGRSLNWSPSQHAGASSLFSAARSALLWALVFGVVWVLWGKGVEAVRGVTATSSQGSAASTPLLSAGLAVAAIAVCAASLGALGVVITAKVATVGGLDLWSLLSSPAFAGTGLMSYGVWLANQYVPLQETFVLAGGSLAAWVAISVSATATSMLWRAMAAGLIFSCFGVEGQAQAVVTVANVSTSAVVVVDSLGSRTLPAGFVGPVVVSGGTSTWGAAPWSSFQGGETLAVSSDGVAVYVPADSVATWRYGLTAAGAALAGWLAVRWGLRAFKAGFTTATGE